MKFEFVTIYDEYLSMDMHIILEKICHFYYDNDNKITYLSTQAMNFNFVDKEKSVYNKLIAALEGKVSETVIDGIRIRKINNAIKQDKLVIKKDVALQEPLTLAQAAEYCGIAKTSLTHYIYIEKGPKYKKVNGRSVFTIKNLDRWNKSRKRRGSKNAKA